MSVEDIDAKISELTLLKSQKLAEAESKKPQKTKKKEKAGSTKWDVKVPKVQNLITTNSNFRAPRVA